MKFVSILLFIFAAVYFDRTEVVTGLSLSGIKSSIARNVFFFLSNCTSGAGETRLLFYSPSANATQVRLDGPERVPLNPSLSTVLIIHGFLSDGTKDWVNNTISALLKNQPRNIFAVDWRTGACSEKIDYLNFQWYSAAAGNTREVGEYVAGCIKILVNKYSVRSKDIWIIGHSLGAHVAGFAGKSLAASGMQKLGRITGLDPAGPLFRGLNSTARLDKTDADFVEVTHTSSLLGLQEAIGDVDIYYNGGQFQRGCILSKPGCSHDRAVDYYMEAIRNSSCQFLAKAWSPVDGYKNTPAECKNSCTVAGPSATTNSARGSFYVATNNGEPFCTGQLPSSGEVEVTPTEHYPIDENMFDTPF